jgi:hypothetical protein
MEMSVMYGNITRVMNTAASNVPFSRDRPVATA